VGRRLKTAARDLNPNADDAIGRKLSVLYRQTSLVDRLGKVRLKMFANACQRCRDLNASHHKPTP
jgi:hypothetical protein